MTRLTHHDDAAALGRELRSGVLGPGHMGAGGVDHGKPAVFHGGQHLGRHPVGADDHRRHVPGCGKLTLPQDASRGRGTFPADFLHGTDGLGAASGQIGHHLRVVDERPERVGPAPVGDDLVGHVQRPLHPVAGPGPLRANHFHG